jgi:hypothetical protein
LKSQEKVLESLEKDLGLPRGFCFRLRHEDDWSFVVKLHALIESAAEAGDSLVRLGNPRGNVAL